MIAAGIGCRARCPADDIVAAFRAAVALSGAPPAVIAAPVTKSGEGGLREAALAIGLPLRFVASDAMAAAQSRCCTVSERVRAATGFGSVAEAAALAEAGASAHLLVARVVRGAATCAIAGPPA